MAMRVRVRLPGRIILSVDMPVVLVMDVRMGVLDRLVPVLVFVVLREMQPHAKAHQHTGRKQRHRQRLLQQAQRRDGAQERRR